MTILRRLSPFGRRISCYFRAKYDRDFLAHDVPLTKSLSPRALLSLVHRCNGRRLRVLEIGSREVTGPSTARRDYSEADYVGFDYYPGPNVDAVGDVHQLSSYFGSQDKFDIIFSFASFEHFAMPWVVAPEISSVLNIGGILYIRTHFSYGSHERPWHFFQFTDMGLRVLFSRQLGFECLDSGMSNPMVGRFSALADARLRFQPVKGLYCGSEYLGRKVSNVRGFDWSKVNVEDAVGNTCYPLPAQRKGSNNTSDKP